MNLSRARKNGISTVAECLVLESLRNGAVPIMSLTDASGLPGSTASRTAYSLSRRGLVQYGLHPTDRRVRLASLTKKGAALVGANS